MSEYIAHFLGALVPTLKEWSHKPANAHVFGTLGNLFRKYGIIKHSMYVFGTLVTTAHVFLHFGMYSAGVEL